MALSGVEIVKHLPKTNCKKCGRPTCLAFAMKLAAKQASLDACPDASEDAKKILGASAAPPIRGITIGTGDKAVKVGDEICMFRHEKKFFNPNVFAVAIMSPWAWRSRRREIAQLRLASMVVGMGFVVYLIYAELYQIGSWCLYCTFVHVITFVLFCVTVVSAALWGLPAARGLRRNGT